MVLYIIKFLIIKYIFKIMISLIYSEIIFTNKINIRKTKTTVIFKFNIIVSFFVIKDSH